MTKSQASALRDRLEQWKRAAPVLQQVRDEDIRRADTKIAMRIFTGSAAWAAKQGPLSQLVSLKDEVSTTPIHHPEPPQSKSD